MKKLFSLVTIMAVAFAFSCAAAGVNVYAAAKKYPLPKEVWTENYEDDGMISISDIKYDKHGNVKSALLSEMIPVKYTIKYKNKKGVISTVSFGNSEAKGKKYYDKKGRLTKVKAGKDVYKYKTDKKGIIKKVTLNGKKLYGVKKISYHKNGFVSKVVYSNGNVNKYNSSGLMTAVKVKGGSKYTYKYTKKNGKVVKILVKCDGEKYQKTTIKYGKSKTKDVWKYSCLMNYAGGPSNATELYSKGALSGLNALDW